MIVYEHTEIARDGDLNLQALARQIGWSEIEHGAERGLRVVIYETEGEQLIWSVVNWSNWDGEETRSRAGVCQNLRDVRRELIKDQGGNFGRISKEAWEQACSALEYVATEIVT